MSKSDPPSEHFQKLLDCAQSVSDRLNSDVILFNQVIDEGTAASFHGALEDIPHKTDAVFLMLATLGGDPHAAYMIARDLQLRYQRITICIAGDCYSAGTLIVLCANELVITDRGRLGPLDAQVLKKDELGERLSGLTVGIALDELNLKASEAIGSIALGLKKQFKRSLSFRTALDIASNVAGQVFSDIYKQIDPIRIGEDARSLQIASHYGRILERKSSNLKPNALERLLTKYPAHECIIDRSEAEELFRHLRKPSHDELTLLTLLKDMATDASSERSLNIQIVFPVAPAGVKGTNHERQDNTGPTKNGGKPNGRRANGKPGDSENPQGGVAPAGKED